MTDPGAELKRRVVEFARGASTEISTHGRGTADDARHQDSRRHGRLSSRTRRRRSLDDVVRVAMKVQALGFRASPHIVARRIESESALRAGLRELVDGGVEQVLLVAGDLEKPAGKFTSTLEIIDSGAIVDAGLKRLAVAGHPEGHKAVGPTTLWAALKHKQEFADRTGIKVQINTQFGFNPQSIVEWGKHLGEHGISLPVLRRRRRSHPLAEAHQVRHGLRRGRLAALAYEKYERHDQPGSTRDLSR